MSDNEHSGEDLRAWAARIEAEGESDEPEVRITSFGSPRIPADRLGHIENPSEMWLMFKPIGEPPVPADADGWGKSFVRAAAEIELKQFFEEHYHPLVRYCTTLVRNPGPLVPEDVATEVFKRAAEQTPAAPRTVAWLHQTAHQVIDEAFLRNSGIQP